MRHTSAEHPAVTGYLRQLDAALRVAPASKARELREQITAHLQDAIPPGTGDDAAAEVVRQLGRPSELAAELTSVAGKRPWPARLGWRWWAVIAVLAAVAAALTSYVIVMQRTAPLTINGLYTWWSPQDNLRAVNGPDQTTVPIRPGQRQGFVIEVFNYTSMTQTVLGTTLEEGPHAGTHLQFGVSTTNPMRSGENPHALHYALPVSIPPGQSRAVRVIWTSQGCLPKGDWAGISLLELRVRVGWFTRIEELSLDPGWFLGPNNKPCS